MLLGILYRRFDHSNKHVLFIKNHQSEEEDYQYIDLVMYQNDDEKELTSLLEREIQSVKEREITFAIDCKECSFLPKNNTSIYNYVVELDKEEWNVDQAYALYDWKDYPENCLFQNVIFFQKITKLWSFHLI